MKLLSGYFYSNLAVFFFFYFLKYQLISTVLQILQCQDCMFVFVLLSVRLNFFNLGKILLLEIHFLLYTPLGVKDL